MQLASGDKINSLVVESRSSNIDLRFFILLFPGSGGGAFHQSIKMKKNTSVIRIQKKLPFKSVVMGKKSSLQGGYSDQYRLSRAHAEDVREVIEHYNTQKSPVFLVGTSRSVLSVLSLAEKLQGVNLKGVVVANGSLGHKKAHQISLKNVSALFICATCRR